MGQLSSGIRIPGVFEKDGRYYKIIKNKWHPLSRIDEGTNALYRALFELDPIRPRCMSDLFSVYRAAGMDDLKPATKKDYEKILIRLDHHFGKMRLGALTSNHIAVWLEKRRKAGRGATRANREFAVLSSCFKFGMRQENWGLNANPCYGVSRNKEKPKKGTVSDQDFLAVFNLAEDCVQDLFAVAFLSGVRETDVVAWTRSANMTAEGLCFIESKTGKPHTVRWSDALRFFVRRACERHPEADHIFLNTQGQPWGQWAINSQVRRLRAKAGVRWCFKDLRSKAQTDSPHSVLGHGAALEAVYRKHLKTDPVR